MDFELNISYVCYFEPGGSNILPRYLSTRTLLVRGDDLGHGNLLYIAVGEV